MKRWLMVTVCATVVTGCSAAVYENEISAFKTATDAAVASVTLYDREAREIAARNAIRIEMLGTGQVAVTLSGECPRLAAGRRTGDEKCRVLTNGAPMADTPSANATKIATLMGALSAYAGNLEKVASADDIAAANTAIGGLSQSVVSLGKAFVGSDASKAQLDAAAGPIVGAFNWIAGNYLTYKRWEALKSATGIVQPAMKNALPKLNELAVATKNDYAQRRLTEFDVTARYVKRTPGTDPVPGVLDLQKTGSEVAAVINSKPEAMFDAMVEAHGELTKALDDPTKQAPALLAALQGFGEAVAAIVKSLEKKDDK